MTKSKIRQKILRLRRTKSSALQNAMQLALQEQLPLLLSTPPLVVSGYVALPGEVDPMPVMHLLYQQGYTLCLPVVLAPETPLLFRQWTPETVLSKQGPYSIPEPPSSAPTLEPNAVLTPLVAFDRRCHRIGFGAGFYDRTLQNLRQKQNHLRYPHCFLQYHLLHLIHQTHQSHY